MSTENAQAQTAAATVAAPVVKIKVTVSSIQDDLKQGLSRDDIKAKYGLSADQLKAVFQHEKLKGLKTRKTGLATVEIIDDTEDSPIRIRKPRKEKAEAVVSEGNAVQEAAAAQTTEVAQEQAAAQAAPQSTPVVDEPVKTTTGVW